MRPFYPYRKCDSDPDAFTVIDCPAVWTGLIRKCDIIRL
jgi:hypothetical protein